MAALACHRGGVGGGVDYPATGIGGVFFGVIATAGRCHDVCDLQFADPSDHAG